MAFLYLSFYVPSCLFLSLQVFCTSFYVSLTSPFQLSINFVGPQMCSVFETGFADMFGAIWHKVEPKFPAKCDAEFGTDTKFGMPSPLSTSLQIIVSIMIMM